jgi:hypothetical protein
MRGIHDRVHEAQVDSESLLDVCLTLHISLLLFSRSRSNDKPRPFCIRSFPWILFLSKATVQNFAACRDYLARDATGLVLRQYNLSCVVVEIQVALLRIELAGRQDLRLRIQGFRWIALRALQGVFHSKLIR